jgi:arylformamidase
MGELLVMATVLLEPMMQFGGSILAKPNSIAAKYTDSELRHLRLVKPRRFKSSQVRDTSAQVRIVAMHDEAYLGCVMGVGSFKKHRAGNGARSQSSRNSTVELKPAGVSRSTLILSSDTFSNINMKPSSQNPTHSGQQNQSSQTALRFIDLSHPLIHGQPTFPSDPKLAIIPHGTVATLKFNISQVLMGTHQGTHLDAMFHFLEDGRTLDQMPLDWFYGPARLLRIPKAAGTEITVEDLKPFEQFLQPEAKVVLGTGWYKQFGAANYFTDFPSLTLEAGRYLASRKIRLLGMDMPTPSKQWLGIHHIFLAKEAEIVLVEGLTNLDAVPDEFTFAGFPLNFQGRDGSPVRAVAICQSSQTKG